MAGVAAPQRTRRTTCSTTTAERACPVAAERTTTYAMAASQSTAITQPAAFLYDRGSAGSTVARTGVTRETVADDAVAVDIACEGSARRGERPAAMALTREHRKGNG